MKKLTSKKLRALAETIGKRDGWYCFACQVPGNAGTLFLDFWNCDSDNNDRSNLRLLCPFCQVTKSPWLRRKHDGVDLSIHNICVSINGDEDADNQPQTDSLELQKNMTAEPICKRVLFREIIHQGRILNKKLLDIAAAEAHCSQITARRYFGKETSDVRPYMATFIQGKRYIFFRPQFETFRNVLQEKKEAAAMLNREICKVDGIERFDRRKKKNKQNNATQSTQSAEEKTE